MIDDFKRPRRRIALEPTKLDTRVFKPSDSRPSSNTANPVAAEKTATGTQDKRNTTSDENIEPTHASDSPSKKPKKSRKFWTQWSKKKKIIVASLSALLLIGAGTGAVFALTGGSEPPVVAKKEAPKTPAPPAKIYSTLSGLEITDPAINTKTVTAVMIENSLEARPQSGLDQAGVVFEAIAEGGITRFMALYQDTEPDHLGPVRSARPYYVQWARGFDAAYAHVGGSPLGLQTIKDLGVRDLDQGANGGSYERVTNRYSPHNVYTSLGKLNQLEQTKGYNTSTYTGFARKDPTANPTPNASAISLAISSSLYNVNYTYDAASNGYLRNVGGSAHTTVTKDGASSQLAPKVVIAMTMSFSQSGIYSQYNVIGSGQVHIFQDGIVTIGTWQKESAEAQVTFKDANGQPIPLNRGQTWITAVAGSDRVSYTP